MVACSNHGKSLYPKKSSLLSSNNQIPFVETFVTSAPEMRVPRGADFIVMLLREPEGDAQSSRCQTVVLGNLEFGIEP